MKTIIDNYQDLNLGDYFIMRDIIYQVIEKSETLSNNKTRYKIKAIGRKGTILILDSSDNSVVFLKKLSTRIVDGQLYLKIKDDPQDPIHINFNTNKKVSIIINNGKSVVSPITYCSICGKTFDIYDFQESRSFHDTIGYGSKYDGDKLNLDLCVDCFDDVLDYVIAKRNGLSKINTIDILI